MCIRDSSWAHHALCFWLFLNISDMYFVFVYDQFPGLYFICLILHGIFNHLLLLTNITMSVAYATIAHNEWWYTICCFYPSMVRACSLCDFCYCHYFWNLIRLVLPYGTQMNPTFGIVILYIQQMHILHLSLCSLQLSINANFLTFFFWCQHFEHCQCFCKLLFTKKIVS